MKEIKTLVEAYRSVMIWTPDEELYGTAENWVDKFVYFEAAVADGIASVKSDCEDFSLSLCTAVFLKELLLPDEYGLMLVSTNDTDQYNHCVAWFKMNDVTYIADNSTREPFYKFSNMRHKAIQHNKYSKPREWFEVV